MNLYTAARLAQLPSTALDGPVAMLCRQDPETQAPAAAPLIETWVARYNPPPNVLRHLVDADESNFWSALGELTTAAALDEVGFTIDMRPRLERPGLEPLTPDIIATKSRARLVVEVVTKSNDQKTEDERALLKRVATDLQGRLDLPGDGFLSLTVLPVGGDAELRHPSASTLDEIAEQLNRWLRSTPTYRDMFRYERGPFPVYGNLMRGDKPQVALTPLGGALSQSVRIGRSVAEKVARYAPLVDDQTQLSVAVVSGGWKVTENQVLTAMLGHEQLQIDPRTREAIGARYDGHGAAVVGGPFDGGHADALSGIWFLERTGFFQIAPAGVPTHVSFLHSPYARYPLAPSDVGAPRQLVVNGGAVTWQGDPGAGTLLLQ